jgi:predicted dehydrogenase/flavin reductase (DIM6/NTAB) family NADH-FMN oxidoreductase RutF
MTATFAQVSLSPPRLAINPNRLYPIEAAIRKTGRFAINVMPADARDQVIRLIRVRRREPWKTDVLGMKIHEDHHSIPFVDGALRTVFCEVESMVPRGDHTLIVGRVLESRLNPAFLRQRPLFYREVAGSPSRFPSLSRVLRTMGTASGALDLIRSLYHRRRPRLAPNLARTTYLEGGQTETEITEILKHGLVNGNRRLAPPPVPAIVRKQIGVCVVGTGWGLFHCQLIRQVCPTARLFVCGRNAEKTTRVARSIGAEDLFIGMEAAIADPRVHALTLALPHDLHRWAVEMAAAAGKHALVEKPIATTLADADAMIEAARRAGTILMVAEDMHFRPAIREAVHHIARGDIGEPLYLLAHAGGIRRPSGWAAEKNRMGGGVLMDIGVHYVHALRMLMGEPKRVVASRAMQINTKISGEDSVQLLCSSNLGWEAHLLLSWASNRGHLPDLVVLGEKGTLHLWPSASYFDYYSAAPLLLTRLVSYVRPYWLQNKLMRPTLQRVRITVPGRGRTGYEAEMQEFLSAVAEQRPPALLPEEGRRDLEIVLHCYESLDHGTGVQIAPYHVVA